MDFPVRPSIHQRTLYGLFNGLIIIRWTFKKNVDYFVDFVLPNVYSSTVVYADETESEQPFFLDFFLKNKQNSPFICNHGNRYNTASAGKDTFSIRITTVS